MAGPTLRTQPPWRSALGRLAANLWRRCHGRLLAAAGSTLLLGCAAVVPHTPPAAGTATASGTSTPTSAHMAALLRLLDDSDEAMLARNPLIGLYRGDARRAGEHGDWLSPAYRTAERAAAEADLAALARLPRAGLPPTGHLVYDSFAWQRRMALQEHSTALGQLLQWQPLNWYDGWHMNFAELSSGESAAPYRTVADYEAGLSRMAGFVAFLETAITRSREGMAHGVVLPRLGAEHLLAQFTRFADQPHEQSPYWAPLLKWPAGLPGAERGRLQAAYAAALDDNLRPALRRVQRFLADEYLGAARDTVGWSALPGGAQAYALLVQQHTTTELTPTQIHALGEREVARITQAMAGVQAQLGVPGPLAALFDHVRNNPRLKPTSARQLGDAYRAIGHQVATALPRLFAQLPRTALEIRPIPDYKAANAAAGQYMDGSLKDGRPAQFQYNTHDLPSRGLYGMETLYLHEALPGHHLQVALAAENEALPKLLRYGGNTAYTEGWALYAESLGPELGLFTDPYQRFGHLDDEMLRAMRLVVDTGLHAFGWTRERAINYMLAHSAMGRTEAVAEVERYIANPGQALAYKVGQLTIRQLRVEAEQALGARFDVRTFHDQVLGTGALPLGVLEAKIGGWVAAQRR